MNRLLPLLPLVSICCHAHPYSETSASADLARTEAQYIALQCLQRAYSALYEHSDLPPVDKNIFLQAFAEQIRHPQEQTATQLDSLYEEMAAYRLQQLRQADFFTPHAAQPGVRVLANRLQYDVYASATEEENYNARRAHRISAFIPGTGTPLPLTAIPLCVEEALYDAPRGLVWRFILSAELLDAADAAAMAAAGIHTVEILAMRPTTTEETYGKARAAFAAKKPSLPHIAVESEAHHRLRSALWGKSAAPGGQVTEDTAVRIASLLHLLHDNHAQNKAELEQRLAEAENDYFRALEALTEVRQTQIADDIMLAQREIPGTVTLSNGILCRTLPSTAPAVDIRRGARFMEYEELGSAAYYRVKQRIINAENDLPEQILHVVGEIPRGAAWEFTLPPQLRGNGQILPLRYRIYSKRQQGQIIPPPLLPGTL